MAYSGSLISQNFGETDLDHGFLEWDVHSMKSHFVRIENQWGYHEGSLSQEVFQFYHSSIHWKRKGELCKFIPKYSNLKVKFQSVDDLETQQHFIKMCKEEIPNVKLQYEYKKNFNKIQNNPDYKSDDSRFLEDGNRWIRTFVLEKLQDRCQISLIERIISELLLQYAKNVQFGNRNDPNWCIHQLSFDDMFGYGKNNKIDFSQLNIHTVTGIFGKNSYGKSTIIDIITFLLYGKITRSSHGNSVPKEVIHSEEKKCRGEIVLSVGSKKFKIVKDCVRNPKTDKIKVTETIFAMENDQWKNISEEHRKKSDKVIESMLGNFENFCFTNVCLQQREKVFREMTQKDRKEFLYSIFGLDWFEKYRKDLEDEVKSLRGEEKAYKAQCENTHRQYWDDLIQSDEDEIERIQKSILCCQDKILEIDNYIFGLQEQVKMVKFETQESFQNKILEISKKCLAQKTKIKDGILKKDKLVENLSKEDKHEILRSLEKVKEDLANIKTDIPKEWLPLLELSEQEWEKKFKQIKERLDNSSKITNEWTRMKNELETKLLELRSQNKIHPFDKDVQILNDSEFDVVSSKVNKIKQDIPIFEQKMEETFHEINESLDKLILDFLEGMSKYKIKECTYRMLRENMNETTNIEFNQDCTACMNNPIYLKKHDHECKLKSVERELKLLENSLYDKITNIKTIWTLGIFPDICFDDLEIFIKREISSWKDRKNEFLRKRETIKKKLDNYKLLLKRYENTILYRNDKEFKDRENDILHDLSNHPFLIEYNLLLEDIQNYKIFQEVDVFRHNSLHLNEAVLQEEKRKIESRINELESFEKQLKQIEYEVDNLEKENYRDELDYKSLQDDFLVWKSNQDIKSNIEELKKSKNIETTKCNEYQKKLTLLQINLDKNEHCKKEWEKNFVKLTSILEEISYKKNLVDCIDRDGLPLFLLKMYLPLLEEDVNHLLQNFMGKKLHLRVLEKDVCIGVDQNNSMTCYFGGMESFLIDLSLKIIFSKYSNLPRSNFFIIDEGISVFDHERMSNIHVLFNFLSSLNEHVFLISHLPMIKDYVSQSIELSKDASQKTFLNLLV
jgi:DNA repair exonuclease SbcCD ATPase subunit